MIKILLKWFNTDRLWVSDWQYPNWHFLYQNFLNFVNQRKRLQTNPGWITKILSKEHSQYHAFNSFQIIPLIAYDYNAVTTYFLNFRLALFFDVTKGIAFIALTWRQCKMSGSIQITIYSKISLNILRFLKFLRKHVFFSLSFKCSLTDLNYGFAFWNGSQHYTPLMIRRKTRV